METETLTQQPAVTIDDLDPADCTPSCGLPHRHAPHVIRAAVGVSGCRGYADRPAPPDRASDPAVDCGCSDLLCPCGPKPGHGPYTPADWTLVTQLTRGQDEVE